MVRLLSGPREAPLSVVLFEIDTEGVLPLELERTTGGVC